MRTISVVTIRARRGGLVRSGWGERVIGNVLVDVAGGDGGGVGSGKHGCYESLSLSVS